MKVICTSFGLLQEARSDGSQDGTEILINTRLFSAAYKEVLVKIKELLALSLTLPVLLMIPIRADAESFALGQEGIFTMNLVPVTTFKVVPLNPFQLREGPAPVLYEVSDAGFFLGIFDPSERGTGAGGGVA